MVSRPVGPDAPTFNGARAFRLRGALNLDALSEALRTIVTRHESAAHPVIPGDVTRQVALEQWSLDIAGDGDRGDRAATPRSWPARASPSTSRAT